MAQPSVTTETIETLRPFAFAIAYRMLGSVTEAEDVVQESLLRLHQTEAGGERVDSPRAFVSTIATRLAIDELKSARVRRERYVGDWLPEPVVTGGPEDPAAHAEMADSLSLAFLVVLESLTPEQRAVLLLRDAFDYGYDEIARILDKREDNVRQIATRARRDVAERRPRFEASREQREELSRRFFAAAQDGDLSSLEKLLAQDVVLRGDGGGKVPALARALLGRERVARTLASWFRAGARIDGTSVRRVWVNGQPGALLLGPGEQLVGVMALDIADGQVQGVSSIVNPDKLRHIGTVGDMRELLRRSAEAAPPQRNP